MKMDVKVPSPLLLMLLEIKEMSNRLLYLAYNGGLSIKSSTFHVCVCGCT